jgi:RecB family exonuclease
MRIEVAALALAACASAPSPRPADACASYGAAVRAPLARMGQAADRFGDHMTEGPDSAARASRELAAALQDERGRLAAVETRRPDIAAAHASMIAALDDLAAAMRLIGDVLATRDEARRELARERLRVAEARWRGAVEEVRRVCP